jgi:hypothetical protein
MQKQQGPFACEVVFVQFGVLHDEENVGAQRAAPV